MVITNFGETIDRWMRQADHDLENAKKNLRNHQELIPSGS